MLSCAFNWLRLSTKKSRLLQLALHFYGPSCHPSNQTQAQKPTVLETRRTRIDSIGKAPTTVFAFLLTSVDPLLAAPSQAFKKSVQSIAIARLNLCACLFSLRLGQNSLARLGST